MIPIVVRTVVPVCALLTVALAGSPPGSSRAPGGADGSTPVPGSGSIRASNDPSDQQARSFLGQHLVVAWYGNPHTAKMGILGARAGEARAAGLREQAQAYAAYTTRSVVPAYELVAIVAQPHPGRDGKYRRRENPAIIQRMLDEARRHGFHLILDVQPGHSTVRDELEYLRRWLSERDVHVAIDPEFHMQGERAPGEVIGSTPADSVNDAVEFLERLIRERNLPAKMLVVHQFTRDMLPDKEQIRDSPVVDLVLDMDGFGSPPLKRSTWRMVMRQHALEFAGFKLFYQQDQPVMSPEQVMSLTPTPSLIIYQ